MVRIKVLPDSKRKKKKFKTTTAKVRQAFEFSPSKRSKPINYNLGRLI